MGGLSCLAAAGGVGCLTGMGGLGCLTGMGGLCCLAGAGCVDCLAGGVLLHNMGSSVSERVKTQFKKGIHRKGFSVEGL